MLRPYLGGSTIGGSTVYIIIKTQYGMKKLAVYFNDAKDGLGLLHTSFYQH